MTKQFKSNWKATKDGLTHTIDWGPRDLQINMDGLLNRHAEMKQSVMDYFFQNAVQHLSDPKRTGPQLVRSGCIAGSPRPKKPRREQLSDCTTGNHPTKRASSKRVRNRIKNRNR